MRRAWLLAGVFALGCSRRDDAPRADRIVSAQLAAPIPAGVTVEELAPSILLHIDGVEGIILRKEHPPTVLEAITFERGLSAAIATARGTPHALDFVPAHLPSMKRVYFAREQDGHRLVGANLYCVADADRTWTLTGIGMADGGDCNVLAWYEPGTRMYRVKRNMGLVVWLPADGS